MALSDEQVDVAVADILHEFHGRHQRLQQFFLKRFEQVRHHLLTDQPRERRSAAADRRLLHPGVFAGIGGPVQSVDGLAPRPVGPARRTRRFILSLRATGEGHISSITFRSGTIDAEQRDLARRADAVRHDCPTWCPTRSTTRPCFCAS